MFLRKKPNKSGKISVQVVVKTKGRQQKVVKTIGSSSDEREIERYVAQGRAYIEEQQHLMTPDFNEEDDPVANFLSNIYNNQIQVIGPELIFGALYDKIGYNEIDSDMFRHLVICRLFNPGSKLKTVDYLQRYLHEEHSVSSVYKFLDELCYPNKRKSSNNYKTQVENISLRYTKKVLGDKIAICFIDLTTLPYEAIAEEDLRFCELSKVGKHSCPQIYLGLLVSSGGNPIGYEIFEGNTLNGSTLISLMEKLATRFGCEKPIVVAEAGLLSKTSIKKLTEQGYEYILGGSPKSESQDIKEKILGFNMQDGDKREISRIDESRLILSLTEKRKKMDAMNRHRGLLRLQKGLKAGMITKEHINNRGYNRWLKLEGDAIYIDLDLYERDAAWDGIEEYVTNTKLTPKEIIENYGSLILIKKAFRFNKCDLEIRPIYHRLHNRIEGHICICFAAYTILLELERIIKASNLEMSIHKAQELTETMYAINYIRNKSKTPRRVILGMSPEQQTLYDIVKNNLEI